MKWFTGLVSLLGEIFRFFSNKQLIDSGKAQAELEGRKEIDKISDDIATAKSDDLVRDRVRKKYTRKPSDSL